VGRVPRQAGYPLQPQKLLPALAPRLAVRWIIVLLQRGQFGEPSVEGRSAAG